MADLQDSKIEAAHQALEKSFPDIFETDFTARMETELDKAETGEDDWRDVVAAFYRPFSQDLQALQKDPKALQQIVATESTVVCDKCGSTMIKKWGRNGAFLACPRYPECKNTKSLDGDDAVVKLGKPCPKCGAELVKRNGRYGEFGACERYQAALRRARRRSRLRHRCPLARPHGHLSPR